MSMQSKQNFECHVCKKQVAVEVYKSLNPKQHPEAVADILNDKLQSGTCECGQVIRIEPELIYMDVENGICISAFPSKHLDFFKTYLDQAEQSFKLALTSSPLFKEVKPRVTFGWPAFREKLYLKSVDISDVEIEMVKMALIRQSGEVPDPNSSFRLVEVTSKDLILSRYQNQFPFSEMESYEYDMSVLQSIRSSPSDWDPLRESIDQGLFVDLYRLFKED